MAQNNMRATITMVFEGLIYFKGRLSHSITFLASFGKGSALASISPPFPDAPLSECQPVIINHGNDDDIKEVEDHLNTAPSSLKLLPKPL